MPKLPRLRTVTSPVEVKVQKRVPELKRVPADKPVSGICLCNAPFEMPTHYHGGFTSICPGETECQLCPQVGLRIFYLVALLDRNTGVLTWYQLTDNAGLSLMTQIQQSQAPLYGALLKLGRLRKTMNSPVWVEFDPTSRTYGKLPKAVEPTETLERVFNSPKVTGKRQLKVV